MSDAAKTIDRIRSKYGSRLAILGHHYQSDEIIRHCDITGDSLELSRKIPEMEAEHIVFCGVYFMAESAAILQKGSQKIHLPEVNASCPMADMAIADFVETTLQMISSDQRRVIPLTYVNSSAAVKAVVGRWGGSVCTSANAKTMLKWALEKGDSVLFLPDRHLGWNTADALGIPEDERIVLPKGMITDDPKLHLKPEATLNKRLLLWPGYCPIHDEFPLQAIEAIRASEPGAKIVVHPECPPEVTSAADANGSTSFIIKYAKQAPEGSVIYVGTESNLVSRLAAQYAPGKTIKPLKVSYCEDMGKTTESKLAELLQNLETATPVTVTEEIRTPSKEALETMLAVCAQ